MTNYYEYDFENEHYVKDLSELPKNDLWCFWNTVAMEICMSDCSDVEVTRIVWQGREFRYVGWRPGMEYTFECIDNPEETYTLWLPHMDH